MTASAAPRLSILLPVRNEGANLKLMLKILEAVVEVPHEVLVVYDFPEDDSIPVVEALQQTLSNVRLVHNTIGRGGVNAIRAGVEAAAGEYILIFVADDTGPVLSIEEMMGLMDEGCDFVSCTRYAHGGRRLGGSMLSQLLSRTANRLFHAIAGCRLTDATTGIKMFRRALFEKFDLQAAQVGWAGIFEMAIKAQAMGFTLGEIPIISVDRLYGGRSTFRAWPWMREYLRWFLWGVRELRRPGAPRQQVRVRIPPSYRDV